MVNQISGTCRRTVSGKEYTWALPWSVIVVVPPVSIHKIFRNRSSDISAAHKSPMRHPTSPSLERSRSDACYINPLSDPWKAQLKLRHYSGESVSCSAKNHLNTSTIRSQCALISLYSFWSMHSWDTKHKIVRAITFLERNHSGDT